MIAILFCLSQDHKLMILFQYENAFFYNHEFIYLVISRNKMPISQDKKIIRQEKTTSLHSLVKQ